MGSIVRPVYIARSNTRYGNVPNISLIPVTDCGNHAFCQDKCYGVRNIRMYAATRNAWGANSFWFRQDPYAACQQVYDHLCKLTELPTMFRIHVAGDFLNQDHIDAWSKLAKALPEINFLAYTKMDKLDFSQRPENFEVLASQWPRAPLLVIKGVRRNAWIDSDTRKPANAFQCLFDIDKKNKIAQPRTCDKCKFCWVGKNDIYLRLF